MATRKTLEEFTEKFFNKFCKQGIIDSNTKWSGKWYFVDSLPNNESKGCYALLNGDEVAYIGLGISDSYKGSGIGSRVSKYWKYKTTINNVRYYEPTNTGYNSIITLPFSIENFYLAAALEVYLIQHIKTKMNKTHSNKEEGVLNKK